MGVDPADTTVRYSPMEKGGCVDAADLAESRRVAVLGSKAAALLFRGRPEIGETITINGTAFVIVGRVSKISMRTYDFDDRKVYVPITTMQDLFALKGDNVPRDALTSIQYHPTVKGDAGAALAAVHRVVAERHGFDPSMKEAFNEFDTITEEKMIGAIFSAM